MDFYFLFISPRTNKLLNSFDIFVKKATKYKFKYFSITEK